MTERWKKRLQEERDERRTWEKRQQQWGGEGDKGCPQRVCETTGDGPLVTTAARGGEGLSPGPGRTGEGVESAARDRC